MSFWRSRRRAFMGEGESIISGVQQEPCYFEQMYE